MSRRVQMILLAGVGLCCAVALFLFEPGVSKLFAPCPVHALTGFHCPGCGSLRVLHQLLHGDVVAAFGLNPLMVLLLPFIGYGMLCSFAEVVFKKSLPTVFIRAFWIWLLLAVIVGYGIVRNVPVYPFTLLAP